MFIRLMFFCMLFFSNFCNSYENEITEDTVNKYINKVGLEKSVAQIFVVGIPTDYKNSAGVNDFDALISEINIGGVMLNGYNLPHVELKKKEEKTAFQLSSSLINLLKRYDNNEDTYPLLIYVDFESYNFSSIKYPIMPPPSALVLSSTGDTKYSYYAGKVAGRQLRQLGINVILGPVLDLDKSNQGKPNFAIATRAFSDKNKLTISYASAFLEGIKDTGISSFSKHFPSYGAVFSNAHKESSTYTGGSTQLEQDITNFESLSDLFDGVMTSHLIVKEINSTKPVTFNRELIEKYLLNENIFSNKIIITDDLSNMESAKEYIRKQYGSFNYEKSSINAFKAGHDIILYSHISGESGTKHSDFNISELKNSIFQLTKLIKNDAIYMEQFKKSLKKILILKSKHVDSRVSNKFDSNLLDLFEKESDFKNREEFYRKTFDSAVIDINQGEKTNLSDVEHGSKVYFIGNNDSLEQYKEQLGSEYQGIYEVIKNSYKAKEKFDEAKKRLLYIASKADIVVFVAETTDHINLLDTVRLKKPTDLDKFIVFLHGSPHLINIDLINTVKIYGNFSKNPISYLSDIKVLRGEIEPKRMNYLPVSISNGTIHDSNDTVEPINNNYSKEKIVVFNSRYEKELYLKLTDSYLENKKLDDKIKLLETGSESHTNINKNTITFLILFFVFLSLIFLVMSVKENSSLNYAESIKGILLSVNNRLMLCIVIKKGLLIFLLLAIIYPSVGFFKVVIESISEIQPWTKPYLKYVIDPNPISLGETKNS